MAICVLLVAANSRGIFRSIFLRQDNFTASSDAAFFVDADVWSSLRCSFRHVRYNGLFELFVILA
jgi:hypothetical protein